MVPLETTAFAFSSLKFGNLLAVALFQSPKRIDQLFALAEERLPQECGDKWQYDLIKSLIVIGDEIDGVWHIRSTMPTDLIPVTTPPPTKPDSQYDKIMYDPRTGHHVGDDGFRVPKDFLEFYERYPNYIRNWVKKRLARFVVDEDVEDWTQDLIIHMKYLPQTSKHRKPGANDRINGCTDVIETFNPVSQYGASERRFRSYVNMCLTNKFNTVYSKRNKNPICRQGNVTIVTNVDPSHENGEYDVVDDAYCHVHSDYLSNATARTAQQYENYLLANEFRRYVEAKEPELAPVVDAIQQASSQHEAASSLGISETLFARQRTRLKELAHSFQNNDVGESKRKRGRRKTAQVA
jgi:hypothetical protein